MCRDAYTRGSVLTVLCFVSFPPCIVAKGSPLPKPFPLRMTRFYAQTDGTCPEFSPSKLASLISALESETFTSETFKTYLTEVGGLGLGILSQFASGSDLPTPPVPGVDTLETTFGYMSKTELRGWVESLGKWAYV